MAGLTACTGGTAATPEPESTPSSEPTTEPVVDEPTAEPTTEAPPFPTEAGAAIPLDQVEAARAAGIPVYVSPHGGNGVVVQPGQPLPAQVVNDFEAAYGGPLPESTSQWQASRDALTAVSNEFAKTGVPSIRFQKIPTYDGNTVTRIRYSAFVGNVPAAREYNGSLTPSDTKEEALAKVQPWIDQFPGIQVIDLT